MGTPSILSNVVNDRDKRRHYFDRFVYSQRFAQIDPWEERVNGKDAHEFAAMAEFGMPVTAECDWNTP